MTDHLALIAAKTVECPVSNCRISNVACGCRGTLRILDPRFDGIREVHENKHLLAGGNGYFVECYKINCLGYTLVQNLEVLETLAFEVFDLEEILVSFRSESIDNPEYEHEYYEVDFVGVQSSRGFGSTISEGIGDAFWAMLQLEGGDASTSRPMTP